MSKKIIERRKASANVPEKNRASIANLEPKQKRSAVKGILLAIVVLIAIVALLFVVINAFIDNISKSISPSGSYKDTPPTVAKETLEKYKQNNPMYNGTAEGYTEYDKVALLASNNHSSVVNAIIDEVNVFNYAMYGVENTNPNSPSVDMIVIASINKDTNKLTYVLLDSTSLVYIPYANVIGPLKDAYNFGGANLLSRTIAQNFGIDIDGYVDMKLDGAADMVDAVAADGIAIAMSDAEYEDFKQAIADYSERFGKEVLAPEKKGETVTMNGIQTLAYIRGVAADRETAVFNVLAAITKEAIKGGIKGVTTLTEKLSDNATTSTEADDFASLLQIAVKTTGDALANDMTTLNLGKDAKTVVRYQGCTFATYSDYSKLVSDLESALYGE